MTLQREAADAQSRRALLADLVRNVSYEVMPFRNTEQAVVENVPVTVPLTVTVTEVGGIDTTLDLTERLRRRGYQVAPHLPARQFVDQHHVAEVVARLREADVRSVFVVGGDAPRPVGDFPDAYALLHSMNELDHPFEQVGIGGYPEGHAVIPQSALELALTQKGPLATHLVTQICFDAAATVTWAAGLAEAGIQLPVLVGIPGPVNRQKLMRVSARIGLGQSARFLRKQRGLLWKFVLPGGYHPAKLVRRLGAELPKVDSFVRGLHIFTFNELAGTEKWRRSMVAGDE